MGLEKLLHLGTLGVNGVLGLLLTRGRPNYGLRGTFGSTGRLQGACAHVAQSLHVGFGFCSFSRWPWIRFHWLALLRFSGRRALGAHKLLLGGLTWGVLQLASRCTIMTDLHAQIQHEDGSQSELIENFASETLAACPFRLNTCPARIHAKFTLSRNEELYSHMPRARPRPLGKDFLLCEDKDFRRANSRSVSCSRKQKIFSDSDGLQPGHGHRSSIFLDLLSELIIGIGRSIFSLDSHELLVSAG